MKQIRMTERVERELHQRRQGNAGLNLRNLLSNAIKYTGIGGSIEVSAALDGDWVVVRVTDDGAGIDEGTAELLRREEPSSICRPWAATTWAMPGSAWC